MMSSELDTILRRLLAHDKREISLDTIGEVIGAARITQEEIEQLLVSLEQAGRKVIGSSMKVRQNLHPVLEQARRLKDEHQSTPNIGAIAAATGLTVAEVRAALLYASVMGR